MNNSSLPSDSPTTDYRLFLYTQLATGICLAILSPITITSNVLLLFTLFKDPLKCFRAPATYFIVALALVDLTTGLLVEPFFIMHRVATYVKGSPAPCEPYNTLYQIGVWLSYVGLNASFLLVLGLILTQYVAITYPHHYRSEVTTRRVLACVGFSLVYFTGFILLQFVVVPKETLFQVDLHLHSTLITVLLILSSAILLRSLRHFATESRRLVGESGVETGVHGRHTGKPRTNRISEKQFTIVTLLLSGVFIVCSLPHIITVHMRFYKKQHTLQERLDLSAAITIADEMMFVKVALDAFIYAWRLTKYRKSLKLVLTCRRNQVLPETTEVMTMENFTFQQYNPELSSNHQDRPKINLHDQL
ncbi:melanocyte-stimulating hormone receptor-like [Orbicella faveolata]|uniref:melanocyte-stimulating hormone receptor-like n=1 Tax=Orbicella faveolata TaxID=48498 RepID=UPI0009E2C031|nr:melanocyte-stimulating hormone receptor-like [Orbicella faveolata]